VLCWYLARLLVLNSLRGKDIGRGFRFRRKFCRAAVSILDIKYRHSTSYAGGVCLYVSNHRSLLDPLIQLGHLDAFIVSKAEVGSYPVLGRGAKETGIILVHRHDQTSRRYALEAIEEKLMSGYPVLIYPEGTTFGGEFTGEFRRGAIDLAGRLSVPIVPVMIEYPDDTYYWIDGSFLGYFINLFSRSRTHTVIGKVGSPMQYGLREPLVEDTRTAINLMMLETRTENLSDR